MNRGPYTEPYNVYLSEDALLEKPDVSFSFGTNLPYDIDTNDYEESRKLFFSPERINASVESEHSTTVYSGLENETSSEASVEIPYQPSIVLSSSTLFSNDTYDNDVLTISAAERDLDETFDPVIIEQSVSCSKSNYSDSTSPLKGFARESAITLTSNNCVDNSSPSKNPLSTITNTLTVSTEKKKLTLVFSKSGKENGYSVKRKYPSITPDKKIQVDSNISPDIFDDEMIDNKTSYFQIQLTQENATQSRIEDKYSDKLDQKLLKRTQNGMSGVLPPPSVTVMHLSVQELISKFQDNQGLCCWNVMQEQQNTSKESKSFLLSVDLLEAKVATWSAAMNMRCHGLHYNCGKISEEIVDLCDKYQKRFVGAETQSTCTVFETQNVTSPSKRRLTKPKWGGKSPGRRLSHLARRRITFSNANLQAGGSSLAGSRARQILVDAKKIDLLNRRQSPRKNGRKTPKKTPSKSPKTKTRTPSSSAKKKLAMRFRKLTGELENSVPSTSEMSSTQRALFKSPDKSAKSDKVTNRSTKRALFHSPNRDSGSSVLASDSQDSSGSAERSQLRRALFTSPRKCSPSKGKRSPFKQFGFEKKRKRSESDDGQPSKFQRSMSVDIKPSTSNVIKAMPRTQSELCLSLNRSQTQNELSEQHKKKLLWAVSGALQSQNVTNAHPQWKVYASVLARVTRRFFTSQMASSGARPEGGTTERMHRIARYHVISVVKGKTADEIVNDYVKSRAKVQRPQGYVAPENFDNAAKIKAPSGGKENVFHDRANTIESWEKRRLEQTSKPPRFNNRIESIRKVINFGDDR